jgi:D-arabinose 1-dehydrogenase-like Zn-dependent alcohol dehydrogenase
VEEKNIVLGCCMVQSFHEILVLSCIVGHEIAGHVAWHGEKRNDYGVSVGKP